MRKALLLAVALAGSQWASHAQGAATIPLASGVPVSFALPANQFTNDFYFDVGAGDAQIRVELQGQTAGDMDMYLRYGSPFPDFGDGGPPEQTFLYEHAQYRSQVSDGPNVGNESITIGRYNPFPVRAGRWHLSVLSFANTAINATIRLTLSSAQPGNVPITVVLDDGTDGCDISGWNDSTPRGATGGNSGTTLGAQRRNAIMEAARVLGTQLQSPVPVRVQACWADLGSGDSVTLASAGPRYIFRNRRELGVNQQTGAEGVVPDDVYPFLPRTQTWYSSAPATKMAGAPLCGMEVLPCSGQGSYDIRARFNTQVDTPQALGDRSYYYGFTPGTGADVDFIATAMHEITHGLGFLSLVEVDPATGNVGAKESGYDDIYAANLARVQGDGINTPYTVQRFTEITNAERAVAMVGFNQVRWDGPEAVNSDQNIRAAEVPPENFIRIYSPDPIQPGSSISHVSGTGGDAGLMLAQATGSQRTLGIAAPMLAAMGWTSQVAQLPQAFLPRGMQFFDPRRPSHGIDVQQVVDNIYFVTMYTYGTNGEPEWYVGIGPIVDGVFMPASNPNGDSFVRYRYTPGGNPPQSADPAFTGQIRLDFNQARLAPACNDGTARDQTNLVLMTWSLGNDRNQNWCMQALIPEASRATPDFTGSWFAGAADGGWGFSLIGFDAGATNGLFGALYYPDSAGSGRWAFMQTDNLQPGVNYPLFERRGYCRTCAVPAITDIQNGTIKFTLNQPSNLVSAGNTVEFSATYQQAPGGTFSRPANTPLVLLSLPVPPP
jgi:hypothetical protein